MKRSLLLASPFWPKHSGLSAYGSVLARQLSEDWDVTLLTDDYTVLDEELAAFPVIRHVPGTKYRGFDAILYNLTNEPDSCLYMLDALHLNPGWVILHSFSLFNVMMAREEEENTAFAYLMEKYGVDGVRLLQDSVEKHNSRSFHDQKDLAWAMPMNDEVISLAQGIFVHSRYAAAMVRKAVGQKRVCEIPRIVDPIDEIGSREAHSICQEYWGIPGGAFVVAAVGFIEKHKQNALTCQAVAEYNKTHSRKIYYLMVGEGHAADEYLSEYCIKTGFVSNALLAQGLARADLVLNLRNPTNGETSGTLLQAMLMGRDCVTTSIGSYDELPDTAVRKLPPELSVEELIAVFEDAVDGGLELGEQAREYVKTEHDARKTAEIITQSLMAML